MLCTADAPFRMLTERPGIQGRLHVRLTSANGVGDLPVNDRGLAVCSKE